MADEDTRFVPDAVRLADRRTVGAFVTSSEELEKLLGLDEEELVGVREVLSAVVQAAYDETGAHDRYVETVVHRKQQGVRTLNVQIEEDSEDPNFRVVPYQRTVFWNRIDAKQTDLVQNSLLGINHFIQQYKRINRRKFPGLQAETLTYLRSTGKKMLTTDVVHIDPALVIRCLEHLERPFWEKHFEGRYEEMDDAEVSKEQLIEMTLDWRDEALAASWWPDRPVLFMYGEGMVLSDLEVLTRDIQAGRTTLSPGRVVWGHYVSRGHVLEMGADLGSRSLREDILAYRGRWLSEAALYPYLFSALYRMMLLYPVQFIEKEKANVRGVSRQHFNLNLDADEGLRAFVQLDEGELKDMKKGTVYDGIPCLDLDVGKGSSIVRIICSKCDGRDEKVLNKVGIAPHVFLKQWSRDGWDIRGDGRKATCPKCIQDKRDAKRVDAHKTPEQVAVVQPIPLHQRQNAARMVLGRSALSDEARRSAETKCRELGIPEADIIRISLKAQGLNPDGSDLSEDEEEGKRRTFSLDFKREFVKRGLRLPADSRSRFLEANNIHPGMFRRWKRELYAADHEAEKEDVEPEVEISESLIDGMIDKGIEMAKKVEAQLAEEEFSDDLKLEVVMTCADMDSEERQGYLQSLDITDEMYSEWKQLLEPPEAPQADGTKVLPASRPVPAQPPVPKAQIHASLPTGPQVDPQLMFALFQLFERGIDKRHKRYQQGWSDERVAREAGCDIAIVVQVREQTIGKVLSKADIEAIQQRMQEREARYEQEVVAIRQMLVDLENQYDEEMKALRAELGQ